MGSWFSKTASKVASGSPPSDYLTSGENIKWQGKPAAIVILGRGLFLTIMGIVYLFCMLAYNGNEEDILPLGIAIMACLLMIVVERRLGLMGGVLGLALAGATVVADEGDFNTYWYLYLIPLIIALLALLINYIYLSRVMFVVTDRRILTRYGIFTLRYADTGIDKIQNVTVIQPWYERILGYGDIYFATGGEKGGIDYESPGIKLLSGGAVSWENVSKPFEVIKVTTGIIHPGGTPVVVVNQPAPQPVVVNQAVTPSTQDRFKELDELKQKGMITQQEYDEKRKQILEKL